MRWMVNLGRLLWGMTLFATINRVWWLLPLFLLIGLLVVFVAIGQAVAPYAIYPMF